MAKKSDKQVNPLTRCMEWIGSLQDVMLDQEAPSVIRPKIMADKEILCEWISCNFTTSDDTVFGQHMSTHTQELEALLCDESTEEVKCGWYQCGWFGRDLVSIRRGIGGHTWNQILVARGQAVVSSIVAPPCSRSPPGTEDLTALHSLPPFLCRWHDCGDTFLDPQTFYMHMRCHGHGVQVRNKSQRQTFVKCGWAGCGMRARMEHIHTHSGERVTSCPHCQTPFANNHKLIDHVQRQQIPGTGYPCEICESTFGSVRLLRTHLKLHYKPRLECEICGEFFAQPSVLARHHRYRHMSDRPYPCSVCAYRAVSSWDLRKHVRRNHAAEDEIVIKREKLDDVSYETTAVIERRYACHLCDSRVAGAGTLTRHFRTLHNMQSQMFRYDICSDGLYRMVESQESSALDSDLEQLQKQSNSSEENFQLLMTSNATEDTPASFAVCQRSDSPQMDAGHPLQIYIEELDERGNVLNYSVVDAKTTHNLLRSNAI